MIKTIRNFVSSCIVIGMLLISNAIIAQTPLSGTYSIDLSGNGDFISFTDAVTALDSFGVSGPVVFEVATGTYQEQVQLTTDSGMTNVNTVTFKSMAGSMDSVRLFFPITVPYDWVLYLNGANFFSFENLTIDNLGSSATGKVIKMQDSDSITIYSCHINASGFYNSIAIDNFAQSGQGAIDYFRLQNCIIEGGGYGLKFQNYSGVKSNSLIIINNQFLNSGQWVRILEAENLIFEKNYCTTNNSSVFVTGISFSAIINGRISNNQIIGGASGPGTSISTTSLEGDSNNPFVVSNNRIVNYLPYSSIVDVSFNVYVNYVHNSIYCDNGFNSTNGISISGGSNIKALNNIIQLPNGSSGMNINGNGVIESNNNAISVPFGSIGTITPVSSGPSTSFTTLSGWQAATGFDSNSIVVHNIFNDSVNLTVCSDSLRGAGIFDSSVIYDFEGDIRQNPPCIGADEFIPISEFGFGDATLCNGDTLILRQDYFDTVVWNSTDTSKTIEISTPGTQTVAVYDACGSDTISFLVSAQLMANIVDSNLCEGTSIFVETGVPNATYYWNNGSTDSTFFVDSAQVVWVSVTDSFGCFSSDTVQITQTYNVIPSFSDSSDFFTVWFTNTSQYADSYSWDFGDGTTSTNVNPVHVFPYSTSDVDLYTVTLTAYNDCGNNDMINYEVRAGQLVSVSDIELTSKISVYPNPSNGVFTVDLKSINSSIVLIEVIDVKGVTVHTERLDVVQGNLRHSVNADYLVSGVYFVRVRVENENVVYRIVVE